MVLEGYAGTGKSTLVERVIADLDKILKSMYLIDPTSTVKWDIQLTATTNKAAEALALITNCTVKTIHSFLGLRVHKDFRTHVTKLVVSQGAERPKDMIIVIDEASQMGPDLLQMVFQRIDNCKILFIGDPAQILDFKCANSPVFAAKFPTARLTKVMRQAEGNPIIELATKFRNQVNNGVPFSFSPDGHHIQHLPWENFAAEIAKEFNRPDWRNNHSKVLAWTNKTVIQYNHEIRALVQGEPQLQIGDYAICNNFISNKKCALKTDQLVQITSMHPSSSHGYNGFMVYMDHTHSAFMPNHPSDRKEALKEAKANDLLTVYASIESNWVDLRAAYACTINKSQGSTYDKVFIDLDDVKKCNIPNQLARLLYVAVSRAREQVFFTGDLI